MFRERRLCRLRHVPRINAQHSELCTGRFCGTREDKIDPEQTVNRDLPQKMRLTQKEGEAAALDRQTGVRIHPRS